MDVVLVGLVIVLVVYGWWIAGRLRRKCSGNFRESAEENALRWAGLLLDLPEEARARVKQAISEELAQSRAKSN